MSNSAVTQSLIGLLVAAFVVFRFAQRELKPRVVKTRSVWVRPIILAVLTVWLGWTTLAVDPSGTSELIAASLAGAILGIVTGVLIVRYTRFEPAGVPNAVRVIGSPVTFGIWIGAFVVRFVARYLAPHGADPRAQLPMNTGTVVLVCVAFIVIAIAFQREIVRLSGAPAVPAP